MRFIFGLLLFPLLLWAMPREISQDAKIKVNNAILAKVHETTISVLDVVKRMDYIFYKSHPEFANSMQAKYQFYNAYWKMVLNEMINTELILADAAAKKLPLTDGEVREEIETRFAPNVMATLAKMGLTYEEAWKTIKTEMIVMRMNWYYVHSKAMQQVTPQMVKESYTDYLQQHPKEEMWKYHVISIKTEKIEEAQKVYELLKGKSLEEAEKIATSCACSTQISKVYEIEGKNLAPLHKDVLMKMEKLQFSQPVLQTSKYNNQPMYKLFYLVDFKKNTPASFEVMADKLKEELLQKTAYSESKKYIEKLKRFYGTDEKELSSDFMPFALE